MRELKEENMEKKLNLPIIKGDPMPSPVLNIDDYLEFVAETLRYFVDPNSIREEMEQEKQVPFIPFSIKPKPGKSER
jgi:hypothetical protein